MKNNLGGRPLKFKSVDELQEKIDAYFAHCDPHIAEHTILAHRRDSNGKIMHDEQMMEKVEKYVTEKLPYTITGLAVWLDTSRQTLINYEDKDEYFDTIKKAKEKCQADLETLMVQGKGNATGAIFSLKNNYNWKDKTEQDITSGGDKIQSVPIIVSEIKQRDR